jgi:hypothetical protein
MVSFSVRAGQRTRKKIQRISANWRREVTFEEELFNSRGSTFKCKDLEQSNSLHIPECHDIYYLRMITVSVDLID